MKYSILKFNLFSKQFTTELKAKTSKFKNISAKVKVPAPKLPSDHIAKEAYGLDKVPPKAGEVYPLPVINSKLIALEEGHYDAFKREPVSAYYSIKVKDKLYHVFNAARYPLGRMCNKIAFIIQGKTSPHYKPNKVEYKDKCIVLNAKYTWLTGKKLEQKLFRHHTGFPGGLKSVKASQYMKNDSVEMVMRSVKGMLPKNKMRPFYLSKVEVIPEGGHDYQKLGLPQFGKIIPVDYNKVFGISDVNEGKAVLVNSTMQEKDIPERFKNIKREFDDELTQPKYMNAPKLTMNQRMMTKYSKWESGHRFRQYKNIRNKAYRYM